MTPYVNIHSHRAGDPGTITVCSHRLGTGDPTPPAPYSAGIHPWDADAITDLRPQYEFLRHADMAAVGEIGLDYIKGVDRERQKEIFAAQLEIASERGLPVIIHCVKAFEDVMSLLGRHPAVTAVFHGYTGSREQTARLINSGHCISLGEVSLRSAKTVVSAKNIPLDRLFLETDDRVAAIEQVYETASSALDIPLAKLKERIYDNYSTLFVRK
jgi:TatD DNase family protein